MGTGSSVEVSASIGGSNISANSFSSSSSVKMELVPAPKVLPAIREKCKKVIGFKAESGLDRDALVKKAKERMVSYDLSAIVANDIDSAGKTASSAVIIKKGSTQDVSGTKANVADSVLDVCAEIL